MTKKPFLLRIALFTLVFCLGLVVILLTNETTGLALADLSNISGISLAEATYDDTLYATLNQDNRGIYSSNDYGRTWQKIAGLPDVAVNALEVHPTNEKTIFVGTNGKENPADGSLWYSNDQGQTWQRYTLSLPADPQGQLPKVTALTVDPNHPGMLYVGTEGRGVYRVQSGYAGFELIGNPSTQNLYVNDIVVEPNSNVYAVTTEGVMVLEDDKWRRIDALPDAPVSLAVDPSDPQTLYAGTVGYGLFRSIDGGQHWQPLNDGLGLEPGIILRIPAIVVDEDNSQHLALSAAYSVGSRLVGDGIYESFNGGRHWVKIADTREIVDQLQIEEGGIYAVTDSGLSHYGNPLPSNSPGTWLWVRSLINLTEVQILTLVLTVVVGALILSSRIEKVFQRIG